MKRFTAMILAALMLIAALGGCTAAPSTDELNIVCTVYPVYDWLRSICGDSVNIKMLGANGNDIHSYQPTAADITAIATADLTVTVGGVSDSWVRDAARNGKGDIFALTEAVKSDLLLAGGEHNHSGEHAAHEYDEHVWLSPAMAAKICDALCKKLVSLDPSNAEKYNANFDAYKAELDALCREYDDSLGAIADKVTVFADRYPFRYLMHDYSVECHAAYDGCEAETSADFETVTRLAAAVKEHSLGALLIIDGSSDALARSIISASGIDCKILTLDSMQATSVAELSSGDSYIEIMKANLAVILAALER